MQDHARNRYGPSFSIPILLVLLALLLPFTQSIEFTDLNIILYGLPTSFRDRYSAVNWLSTHRSVTIEYYANSTNPTEVTSAISINDLLEGVKDGGDEPYLLIQYTQEISLKASDDSDGFNLVSDPFASNEAKENYMTLLQSKGGSFVELTGVSDVFRSSGTPTLSPTGVPTATFTPTFIGDPTGGPSIIPTVSPTDLPTMNPTEFPTQEPTEVPTQPPTDIPSLIPSITPTHAPTDVPTTYSPTEVPTSVPSLIPTTVPSLIPTTVPTLIPSSVPSTLIDIAETVELSMFLSGVDRKVFSDGSYRVWEQITDALITESWDGTNDDDENTFELGRYIQGLRSTTTLVSTFTNYEDTKVPQNTTCEKEGCQRQLTERKLTDTEKNNEWESRERPRKFTNEDPLFNGLSRQFTAVDNEDPSTRPSNRPSGAPSASGRPSGGPSARRTQTQTFSPTDGNLFDTGPGPGNPGGGETRTPIGITIIYRQQIAFQTADTSITAKMLAMTPFESSEDGGRQSVYISRLQNATRLDNATSNVFDTLTSLDVIASPKYGYEFFEPVTNLEMHLYPVSFALDENSQRSWSVSVQEHIESYYRDRMPEVDLSSNGVVFDVNATAILESQNLMAGVLSVSYMLRLSFKSFSSDTPDMSRIVDDPFEVRADRTNFLALLGGKAGFEPNVQFRDERGRTTLPTVSPTFLTEAPSEAPSENPTLASNNGLVNSPNILGGVSDQENEKKNGLMLILVVIPIVIGSITLFGMISYYYVEKKKQRTYQKNMARRNQDYDPDMNDGMNNVGVVDTYNDVGMGDYNDEPSYGDVGMGGDLQEYGKKVGYGYGGNRGVSDDGFEDSEDGTSGGVASAGGEGFDMEDYEQRVRYGHAELSENGSSGGAIASIVDEDDVGHGGNMNVDISGNNNPNQLFTDLTSVDASTTDDKVATNDDVGVPGTLNSNTLMTVQEADDDVGVPGKLNVNTLITVQEANDDMSALKSVTTGNAASRPAIDNNTSRSVGSIRRMFGS